MHTTHGLVDGMLLGTLFPCQSIERFFDIINQRFVIEVLVVLPIEVLKVFQFLYIRHAHVRSQIEVESRNSLAAMHLILGTLHRYTGKY